MQAVAAALPPTTLLFMTACIGFYALVQFALEVPPGAVAIQPFAVTHDWEVYRLITGALAHGSLMHIAMNMMSLYYMGVSLEQTYGSGPLLVLLTFFTLLVSLAFVALSLAVSFVWPSWMYQSAVGFSGVLFSMAVEESMLSSIPTRSVFGLFSVPTRWYPWVLLVILQVILPGVSFTGHLVGLLVGFAHVNGLLHWAIPTWRSMLAVEALLQPCKVRLPLFVSAPANDPVGLDLDGRRTTLEGANNAGGIAGVVGGVSQLAGYVGTACTCVVTALFGRDRARRWGDTVQAGGEYVAMSWRVILGRLGIHWGAADAPVPGAATRAGHGQQESNGQRGLFVRGDQAARTQAQGQILGMTQGRASGMNTNSSRVDEGVFATMPSRPESESESSPSLALSAASASASLAASMPHSSVAGASGDSGNRVSIPTSSGVCMTGSQQEGGNSVRGGRTRGGREALIDEEREVLLAGASMAVGDRGGGASGGLDLEQERESPSKTPTGRDRSNQGDSQSQGKTRPGGDAIAVRSQARGSRLLQQFEQAQKAKKAREARRGGATASDWMN